MALALLGVFAPAAAAAPAAASNPSVDQYVERVPSAGGDRTPGTGPGSGGGEGISPSVRRHLEQAAGADAEALEAVASSPGLGAPDARPRKGDRAELSGSDSGESTLDAVTSAATSGDGGASGWLVGGLALLTVALAGTALVRRRSLTR